MSMEGKYPFLILLLNFIGRNCLCICEISLKSIEQFYPLRIDNNFRLGMVYVTCSFFLFRRFGVEDERSEEEH